MTTETKPQGHKVDGPVKFVAFQSVVETASGRVHNFVTHDQKIVGVWSESDVKLAQEQVDTVGKVGLDNTPPLDGHLWAVPKKNGDGAFYSWKTPPRGGTGGGAGVTKAMAKVTAAAHAFDIAVNVAMLGWDREKEGRPTLWLEGVLPSVSTLAERMAAEISRIADEL
jgi:hypothetical protein